MARKNTRNAQGCGTIRKKTVTRSGKRYTYWEARITVGRDPGTGKQLQRSITGKTQKEVREKLAQAVAEVDCGTYTAPTKLTLGQWLDIWARDYLGGVKSTTAAVYRASIRTYIKPALGASRLDQLHPHAVQGFINGLGELSPATVRLTHGVLHHALEKAVDLGYIPLNPAARVTLPKIEQEEPRPLDDAQVAALLDAVKGKDVEYLVTVALFTGMRMSELLGLTWDVIDFDGGTITVNKQLTRQGHRGEGLFQSPKSGKIRTVTPAGVVFDALKRQRVKQAEMQLRAGPLWCNPHGLVFTVSDGGPFNQSKAGRGFKSAAAAAGMPDFHFHSLRHTYAVNAIRAGDDIKTVQSNLGHATAAFTLDKYGHVTERMKRDSAQRMEHFIKDVMNL